MPSSKVIDDEIIQFILFINDHFASISQYVLFNITLPILPKIFLILFCLDRSETELSVSELFLRGRINRPRRAKSCLYAYAESKTQISLRIRAV